MKNELFRLLAFAALLFAGCGKQAAPAPAAQAPDPAAETAATNDPYYDEAPGLDEEGSREW